MLEHMAKKMHHDESEEKETNGARVLVDTEAHTLDDLFPQFMLHLQKFLPFPGNTKWHTGLRHS